MRKPCVSVRPDRREGQHEQTSDFQILDQAESAARADAVAATEEGGVNQKSDGNRADRNLQPKADPPET